MSEWQQWVCHLLCTQEAKANFSVTCTFQSRALTNEIVQCNLHVRHLLLCHQPCAPGSSAMYSWPFCLGRPFCSVWDYCGRYAMSDDKELANLQLSKSRRQKVVTPEPSKRFAEPTSQVEMATISKGLCYKTLQKQASGFIMCLMSGKTTGTMRKLPFDCLKIRKLMHWISLHETPYPALTITNLLMGFNHYSSESDADSPNFMKSKVNNKVAPVYSSTCARIHAVSSVFCVKLSSFCCWKG